MPLYMDLLHEVFIPNPGTLFAMKYHVQKTKIVIRVGCLMREGKDNSSSSCYIVIPCSSTFE